MPISDAVRTSGVQSDTYIKRQGGSVGENIPPLALYCESTVKGPHENFGPLALRHCESTVKTEDPHGAPRRTPYWDPSSSVQSRRLVKLAVPFTTSRSAGGCDGRRQTPPSVQLSAPCSRVAYVLTRVVKAL